MKQHQHQHQHKDTKYRNIKRILKDLLLDRDYQTLFVLA